MFTGFDPYTTYLKLMLKAITPLLCITLEVRACIDR